MMNVSCILKVNCQFSVPFCTQAMGLMLLPQNAPDALKNVAYLVDEIWYHAGDTSTDVRSENIIPCF